MADNNLMPEPSAPTGTGPRADQAVNPGMDYRRVQQPFELKQPWHIPSSGAAQEAEALSGLFKDFSKTSEAIGHGLNKQAGAEAGAAAGVSPDFQPKSGLAAMTAFGASYNAAAHVTYTAATQNSIEAGINAAEQANPHDPNAFLAHAQEVKEQTLKQTPALYAPEVSNMFDRRIAAGQNRIADATTKFTNDQAEDSWRAGLPGRIDTAVKTAASLPPDQATAVIQQATHTEDAMRDALVKSGKWTQEHADSEGIATAKAFEEGVHKNWAANTVGNLLQPARDGNVDTSDQQLATFLKDPANSPEDKIRIAHEYADQREMFEKQMGELHSKDIQQLSSYIEQIPGQKEGRGGFGPEVQTQIDTARQKGWITEEYARSLSNRVALNAAKGKEDDTDTYNVQRVWDGQEPKFDPKDPKAAKAVDTYFKTSVANNGAQRGSDQYNNLAVSTMQHTSIVPPVVRREIIGDYASGDPDRAAASARLAEKLHDANPLADIYQDDTKSAAFAASLQLNLNAGMPNARAYEMARSQTDPPKENLESRKLQYDTEVKTIQERNPAKANEAVLQSKLVDTANAHFYNSNTPAPPAPTPMRAEFDDLTKEFFSRTGNVAQAQDLAYKQLQATWRMTSVNGSPELMKYGPTKEDEPILRGGIAQAATALGLQDDPASLKLTPFGGTTASQGRYWNLTHANGDVVLDGKNQPVTLDAAAGRPQYADRLAKQKAADDLAAAKQVAEGQALRARDAERQRQQELYPAGMR